MKLTDYLAAQKLSHAAFAERIGVSQAAVTRYARGARFPHRGILAKIKDATGGAVTFSDFLDAREVAE
jgi:transcriptional regulator with XRE-family HTH domain